LTEVVLRAFGEEGVVSAAGSSSALGGVYAAVYRDLTEAIAVVFVADTDDFLEITFVAGIGGKTGDGVNLAGINTADHDAAALVADAGIVTVIVIDETGLVEVPDQFGIYLKEFFYFCRSFQLAVIVVLLQCPAFCQDFFSTHKVKLLLLSGILPGCRNDEGIKSGLAG
jgi:hypothetical protein